MTSLKIHMGWGVLGGGLSMYIYTYSLYLKAKVDKGKEERETLKCPLKQTKFQD